MQVELAYGRGRIGVNLRNGWNVDVVEPMYVEGVPDPAVAITSALRNPIGSAGLKELVRDGETVGIIINDITRATPSREIVSAIVAELSHIPGQDICLFNATGTHRQNTEAELRKMLGDSLVDDFRIIQNSCEDKATQVEVGITKNGNRIWINRELVQCDLKVLTGFIEPHFFAGFSGGGKAVMPGMAGLETILGNHCVSNIAHPKATWGVTVNNPIWEEVHEAARMAGRTFLVNVALNRDKEITGVFAGDLLEAHADGCDYVRKISMREVAQPYDVVLTSNSGYPLDLNLYQTVKGMSAASQIVKPGGAILIAAECWDGIPEHGQFGQLLYEARNAHDLLQKIKVSGFRKQDQWQAQILAQVLLHADVYVYSKHLSPEQITRAMLKPCVDIEKTLIDLMEKFGPQARICIMPEGPVTIPRLNV